jgi:hypothetical protein
MRIIPSRLASGLAGYPQASTRGLAGVLGPGSLVRVTKGQERPADRPELRAAAPHRGGPLGSSGAAPEAADVPSPQAPAIVRQPAMGVGKAPGTGSATTATGSVVTPPGQKASAEAAAGPTAGGPAVSRDATAAVDTTPSDSGAVGSATTPTGDTTPASGKPDTAASPKDTPAAKTGNAADTPGSDIGQATDTTSPKDTPGSNAGGVTNSAASPKDTSGSHTGQAIPTTASPKDTLASNAGGATNSAANPKDTSGSHTGQATPTTASPKDTLASNAGGATNSAANPKDTPGSHTGQATPTPNSKGTPGSNADSAAVDAAWAAAGAPVAPTARRGVGVRVLRRANPLPVMKRAGRGTAAWAKRPSGRLILPAMIVVLLVGAAGTAGAYLVPEALQADPTPSATPAFGADGASASGAGLPGGQTVPGQTVPGQPLPGQTLPGQPLPGQTLPGQPLPGQTLPGQTLPGIPGQTTQPAGPTAPGGAGVPAVTTPPAQQVPNGARPADALATWAQQVGTRAGIPVVAVQAYGYAELVLARTTPSCHLSWTTIAALAKVESEHGSYNGSVLQADGMVQPTIYGLPLDGKGGRELVRDTDQGTLDRDTTYDRAIGPLQFIPSTWLATKVDADNNGVAEPNDIDDASLTAAVYLCKNGRDLSKADAWWDAILSYNAVQPYVQKVFAAANLYGQRSRG